MRLRVEDGDAVGRHFDSVVPVARVRGGVQDADVRADTADDQLRRPQFRQPLLEGRVIERAVALLRQQLAGDGAQLWAPMATLLVMADWLRDPDDPADEWTEIADRIKPRYEDRRRAVLGRYAWREVGRETQHGGGVSVGGRAGRGVHSSGRRF